MVSADFADFAVEHHPADALFDRDARRIMPGFVDIGTLKALAQQLGHKDAVTLLDATLAEEPKTNDLLTKISAMTNKAATA